MRGPAFAQWDRDGTRSAHGEGLLRKPLAREAVDHSRPILSSAVSPSSHHSSQTRRVVACAPKIAEVPQEGHLDAVSAPEVVLHVDEAETRLTEKVGF